MRQFTQGRSFHYYVNVIIIKIMVPFTKPQGTEDNMVGGRKLIRRRRFSFIFINCVILGELLSLLSLFCPIDILSDGLT